LLCQSFDDGEDALKLLFGANGGGARSGGFATDIQNFRSLPRHFEALLHGVLCLSPAPAV